MNWMINLMYIVLLTSLTGSLVTVIWFLTGKVLERLGYPDIIYRSMKALLPLWMVPLVFVIMSYQNARWGYWGGVLFLPTPQLIAASRIFCRIWAAGAAFFLVVYFLQLVCLHILLARTIACSRRVRNLFEEVCTELGFSPGKIRLRLCYGIPTAQIAGVFRPVVLLPTENYKEDQLRAIFCHELIHARHREALLKNLVSILFAFHFFNPLMWWLRHLAKKWSEIACDYEVCMREMGIKAYYSAIVDMVEEKLKEKNLVAPFGQGRCKLRERMQRVMNMYKIKDKSKRKAGMAIAVMLLLSTVSVYATSVEVANVSADLYKSTEVSTEMPQETLALYTEAASSQDLPVESFQLDAVSSTSDVYVYKISCTAKSHAITRSTIFAGRKGQKATVSVSITPANQRVRVGIIPPSGIKNFVFMSGADNAYTFALTETGLYRLYIQNDTDVSVSVSGLMMVGTY